MNPESDQNDHHDLEEQHPSLAPAESAGAAAPAAAAQPDTGLAEHDVRARTSEPQLVAGSTQTPIAATRFVETSVGRLSYTQLAERLAPALQAVDLRIRSGEFADRPLDEALLLLLHAQLSGKLFPEDAGHYRRKEVRVGSHEPPVPHLAPQHMREYILDLDARMQNLSAGPDDLLLEFLAYAEGMLLSIHPFPDLNGRISRLWLTEILQRLKLPPVDVVPVAPAFRDRYLTALAAADRRDWKPLIALWKERLSQEQGINEIVLHGCTPTPLSSYLKALAVLRLVAEASVEDGGDPEASGFWRNDVFVLRTRLTQEQLRRFFLECYRPTPLVAPWGARSGFYAGDSEKAARNALDEISASQDVRLAPYREMILEIKKLLKDNGFDEKASDEKKLELLNLCRSQMPDHLLAWLDTCYVLTSDGRKFPPLLGTGGNEGSGSYVSGFAQQVVAVFIEHKYDAALESVLFGTASYGTSSKQTPGHFSPPASGGVNASSGFEGNGQFNPWDYLLCLEGTVFFAGASTRRHQFDAPQISFPFAASPSGGGDGAYIAAEEQPKQAKRQVMELWLPLWRRATSLGELQVLFSEGRVTLGTRNAANGLDFARALAAFGAERGLGSFQRYAFLMRNGQSFFATSLNRYQVNRQVSTDLISELEHRSWLRSVQRYARDENAPNAFRSASRQLDAALFALTQQPGRGTFQAVLRHIGRIERALSISAKSREAIRMPVPRLSLSWAIKAQDGSSAEFSIATALAGLRMRNAGGNFVLHARRHLAAVSEGTNKSGDRDWEPASRVATWGEGPLTNNLAALLNRRRLEAELAGTAGELLASATGATCADVLAFLDDETDDIWISELLPGLACVDLTEFPSVNAHDAVVLPFAFSLLKVFFTPEPTLRALKWLPPDSTLRLPAEILARLSSGNVEAAVRIAWQRLRALGVKLPGRDPPHIIATDGPRWLAALCIPLTFAETGRLLRGLDLTPEATSAPLPEFLA